MGLDWSHSSLGWTLARCSGSRGWISRGHWTGVVTVYSVVHLRGYSVQFDCTQYFSGVVYFSCTAEYSRGVAGWGVTVQWCTRQVYTAVQWHCIQFIVYSGVVYSITLTGEPIREKCRGVQ